MTRVRRYLCVGAAFAAMLPIVSQAEGGRNLAATLARAGFLEAASGNAPEMRAVAGPRLMQLAAESRTYLCQIILDSQSSGRPSLTSLRIVDARGATLLVCTR